MLQPTNLFPGTNCRDRSQMICSLGERQLIESIRQWLGPVAPPAPFGMGDDCAVLPATASSDQQLITTDSLTYGQHFDQTASPQQAGAKLIKRNLSDIAAMGGTPGHALLNLLCGADLAIDWLEQFIAGLRDCCQDYGVSIVGGDVSQLAAGQFTAALTLCGTSAYRPLLRSTATIGDAIYVTGILGGSIRGKHLRFEPRLAAGRWLAAHLACTAMMDLTDGLGKDLAALLPEGSSASIDRHLLPISDDARACAREDGQSAETHAFCDGEDYELLFTVGAASDWQAFETDWQAQFPNLRLSRIGRIVAANPASPARYLDAAGGAALPWQSGFEHFKRV